MNAAAALRTAHRPILRTQSPIPDFLLPSFSQRPSRIQQHASTTTTPPPSSTPSSHGPKTPPRPPYPLSKEQQNYLDSALRVNQAGELAATLIYAHQTPPLLRTHPHLRDLMSHMHAQEAGHFATFNTLLAHHRIRPTAMYPIWHAAASILGWGTGLMGREAAMACTEAVETEIGRHYDNQVRVLSGWVKEIEEGGGEVGGELRELVDTLKRIRDEELEHLDEAVGEGAKEARPYEVLNRVIRSGCKGAIWVSERV